MGREMRAHVQLALSAALVLATSLVRAEPSATEVALAETLYRQARELMAQGKYDDACPKLAESYRLDRATGTLLNLASCHERQGRVASAWSEFVDAAEAARRDGRGDRVKFAEDRIHALEPQISHLTMMLAPDADAAGLEVRLDGALIGPASRGVPTPVDPGNHAVTARAEHKIAWSRDIDVKASQQETVTIPKLVDAPEPAQTPAPTRPDATTPNSALIKGIDVRIPDGRDTGRPVPSSVFVMGAVTATLGVGAVVTSAVYFKQRSDYQHREVSKDSVLGLGYVNAGLWIGAAGGAVLTGYLYFARPDRKPADHATAFVTPYVAAEGGGLSVQGDF